MGLLKKHIATKRISLVTFIMGKPSRADVTAKVSGGRRNVRTTQDTESNDLKSKSTLKLDALDRRVQKSSSNKIVKNGDFPIDSHIIKRLSQQHKPSQVLQDKADVQHDQLTDINLRLEKTDKQEFPVPASGFLSTEVKISLSSLDDRSLQAQALVGTAQNVEIYSGVGQGVQPQNNTFREPTGIQITTPEDSWWIVCCKSPHISQFMCECIICGGFEHALCTSGLNRIDNRNHVCKHCDYKKIMEAHDAWCDELSIGDVYEEVVVCHCGATDRQVARMEKVVPKAPGTKAEAKLRQKDEKQLRKKLKKLEKKMKEINATWQVDPKTDENSAFMWCNWCGSMVHQKCFGYNGAQCEDRLWLLCARCDGNAVLTQGQTYGGLHCVCGENDENDHVTPRVTCDLCKVQFHIECIQDDYEETLNPGEIVQCPICCDHIRDE